MKAKKKNKQPEKNTMITKVLRETGILSAGVLAGVWLGQYYAMQNMYPLFVVITLVCIFGQAYFASKNK